MAKILTTIVILCLVGGCGSSYDRYEYLGRDTFDTSNYSRSSSTQSGKTYRFYPSSPIKSERERRR